MAGNGQTTARRTRRQGVSRQNSAFVGDFGDIRQPGAYVLEGVGWLVRMPVEALSLAGGPAISMRGGQPVRAVQLCDDPWVPIGEARSIASRLDCETSF